MVKGEMTEKHAKGVFPLTEKKQDSFDPNLVRTYTY